MNRRKKKKYHKDNFWKYYRYYTLTMSSLVCLGLLVLWIFLANYEKKHPYRVTIDFNHTASTDTDEETEAPDSHKGYVIKAPSTVDITLQGAPLQEDALVRTEEIEELAFIDVICEKFSEYQTLKEVILIPTMKEYYIEAADINPMGKSWNMAECHPTYDEDTCTYTFDFPDDTFLREECSEFAISFARDYATFCANDADASSLKKYFPESSEYLRLIASVDNQYNAHTNLHFTEEAVTEFKAYSENLIYIRVEMNEHMVLKSTGASFTYEISLPIYMAKIDGNWIVISIQG